MAEGGLLAARRALSPLCCPQGVRLLSCLYQEALDNCSNEHYPVLLSLLQTSCEPYTRCRPPVRARVPLASSGTCRAQGWCREGDRSWPVDHRLTAACPQVHSRLGLQRGLPGRLRRVHDPGEPGVSGLQR